MTQDPVETFRAQSALALREGRPADAIASLCEAAALRPMDAGIQQDLGRAWMATGEFENAVGRFRNALSLDVNRGEAWFDLGVALERSGDIASAFDAYRRAAVLQPAPGEAWFRAGAVAHTMGRLDEAIGCFRRAAEAGPKTRFGRSGTARALLTQNLDHDAERVLRRAVADDPGNAVAHDLLGHLLADWGRFEEARACFARAVALDPHLAGSYYDLARCRPATRDERSLLADMEAALAIPGLAVIERLRLHLAAGKTADDLGEFALAMARFDAADALRPGSRSFDSAAFDELVDGIIERCNPASMARVPAGGSDSALPILIVGMPRSGTTLVEQIIASHPDVSAGGELNFWNEVGAAWHLAETEVTDPAFFRQAADRYLGLLQSIAGRSVRVTDKMPFNFLWAGIIHLTFPRAVVVHCRRASIDTALSIHQTLFRPDLALPTGGAKLVAYFRSYERLVRHWRSVLPAPTYVEVDYESLTREPEQEIRRLVAACGLAWNDACLRPHLRTGAVRTPSKWQARQPINRHSVERWKHYEPWLGALRDLL